MNMLFLDFINSQWYINHQLFKDPLYDQKWLDEFCTKWNLSEINILNTENMKELIKLRAFLSFVVNKLCKSKVISKSNINKLNQLLSSSKFHKEIAMEDGKYKLNNVPEKLNIEWDTYQIVLSFADALTQINIDRIKLCQNPDCGWVFYDESRGCTRKWCDNTCASLMKVRKFRESKKQHKYTNKKEKK
jgi:predicted RNA-binding Zn ribbon-like protein